MDSLQHEHEENTKRLAVLGDPKFDFGYKIRADKTVLVDKPVTLLAPNLASAIDRVRAHYHLIPKCPLCAATVPSYSYSYHSGAEVRWECPKCSATWLLRRDKYECTKLLPTAVAPAG